MRPSTRAVQVPRWTLLAWTWEGKLIISKVLQPEAVLLLHSQQ